MLLAIKRFVEGEYKDKQWQEAKGLSREYPLIVLPGQGIPKGMPIAIHSHNRINNNLDYRKDMVAIVRYDLCNSDGGKLPEDVNLQYHRTLLRSSPLTPIWMASKNVAEKLIELGNVGWSLDNPSSIFLPSEKWKAKFPEDGGKQFGGTNKSKAQKSWDKLTKSWEDSGELIYMP